MAKVYVGNIDRRTEKRDLEQEFGRFGKIRQIQIWADRHPAGFAFVEYEDDRDAEDAIKDLDDRQFLGSRLRVEWARSTGRKPPPRRRSPAARRGGSKRTPSPRRRRSSKSRSPVAGATGPARRRSPSPRRRSPSPRRRSPSPRRRSPSPRRRSPSPRRRSLSRSPRRSRTPVSPR